jgi:hypothetical protein
MIEMATAGQLSPEEEHWLDPAIKARAEAKSAEIAKHVAPPGTFKWMPPLLDQRRIQWGLVDKLFSAACSFDRVLVWQYPALSEIGSTGIVLTENAQAREKQSANRGILIGAGLSAMDKLRSHGFELGHNVQFIRNSVFRQQAGYIGGQWHEAIMLQVGDFTANEDLAEKLNSGELRVVYDEALGQHVYMRADGSVIKPIQTDLPEDY